MYLSNEIFELANSFMKKPNSVIINDDKIKELANDLRVMKFVDSSENYTEDSIFKTVLMELVGCSINYCYWYGKSNVRPNNSGSTKMGDLLRRSFIEYKPESKDNSIFKACIDEFIKQLSINRFPLLEERINHLNQLKEEGEDFVSFLIDKKDHYRVDFLITSLITRFPGFSSDIFLKRASLFFMQLYRKFGWFKRDMFNLHLAADYQVPKMMKHFSCVSYSPELLFNIEEDQLIPKGSKMECEIRSASILVAKKLCELTDWNIADIDSFFFFNRSICNSKFHLTITTDY